MKMSQTKQESVIKESRFPTSLFAIYLGVLLLMSGIHIGLLVLMLKYQWPEILQVLVPIIYWTSVAIGLTLFTRRKIKQTYELPMHELAEATKRVSNGDFSIYVPTLHTPDKLDYLDIMILDFNKMVEELGSIETLKTDFVSNVSHEMKTPLAIIKNYAQMLQIETLTEDERREYAKTIDDASLRLSNLISNILRLNKLENQTITPDIGAYDVSRQLVECILLYEDAWENKEIELETDLEESVMIEADQSLLEMVWNNLISNAIKFTDIGGTVKLKLTSDQKKVTISITDTGCGMSEESVRHIFDKFYQGDTSHSKEGNGLGLALVKRVLELMNGSIEVDSKVNQGSTFTVKLPKAMSNAINGG